MTDMTTSMAATMADLFNDTNVTLVGATSNLSSQYTLDGIYAKFQPEIAIVNKYVTPAWYVIGFPGNILAFMVWIQPQMRHSSGCYLAALAMADFLFLMLHILFELHNAWGFNILEINVICQSFPIFFYSSQYLSPILVLGFTVERYISICHPFQREKYCTTSRAIMVIISLVIFCLCLHAVQGYFWTYTDAECKPRDSVMEGKTKSVWAVWSWITELLVFGLVPVVILVLNVLVIKEAKTLSDHEEKVLCLKKGSKSTGPSATTFMLLAVSFYLIFTTLPVTVCYAMYTNYLPGNMSLTVDQFLQDAEWQKHLTFNTSRMLIEELGMSHYACNIFIYLLTGKLFRKEIFRLLCRKRMMAFRRKEEFKQLQSSAGGSVRTSANTNGTVAHV